MLARLRLPSFVQIPCAYNFEGQRLLARACDMPGVEDVFIAREYAFLEPLLHRLSDPAILDVGANVGGFTLFVYAHCPSARVLAVEPAPDTAALLRRNVTSRSGRRCDVIQAAVSTSAGEVSFADAGASVSRRIVAPGAGTRVPAVRLSDLIARSERVALLKLDIEGMEQPVLEQAWPDLSRVDALVVEVHPGASDVDAVHRLLAASFAHVNAMRKGQPGKSLLFAARESFA